MIGVFEVPDYCTCLNTAIQAQIRSLSVERSVFQQAEEWQVKQQLEDAHTELDSVREAHLSLLQAHQQLQQKLQEQQQQQVGRDISNRVAELESIVKELEEQVADERRRREKADGVVQALQEEKEQLLQQLQAATVC